MKFILEIEADNAAFDAGDEMVSGSEVASILRKLADKLDGNTLTDGHDGALFDTNGNRVGFWSLD